MRTLAFLCCLFTFGSLLAQSTQTRTPGTFKSVSVNSNIDATLVRGTEYSVSLSGPADVLEALITEVNKDGRLELKFRDGWRKKIGNSWEKDAVRAVITLPALTGVVANGGADVTSTEKWRADEFTVLSNGGADVELSVQTVNLKITANGGSDIEISGKAQNAKVVANGGADINARDMITQDANVTANGGSDIYIHADGKLKVRANGSSDITYYGNASNVDVQSNGSSDVERG